MDTNKYLKVEIFGEEYKLISNDQQEAQILEIVNLINEKMNLLAKNFPHYSKTKIAILASLNLADEIFKNIQEKKNILKKIGFLSEFLDNVLKQKD